MLKHFEACLLYESSGGCQVYGLPQVSSLVVAFAFCFWQVDTTLLRECKIVAELDALARGSQQANPRELLQEQMAATSNSCTLDTSSKAANASTWPAFAGQRTRICLQVSRFFST